MCNVATQITLNPGLILAYPDSSYRIMPYIGTKCHFSE